MIVKYNLTHTLILVKCGKQLTNNVRKSKIVLILFIKRYFQINVSSQVMFFFITIRNNYYSKGKLGGYIHFIYKFKSFNF